MSRHSWLGQGRPEMGETEQTHLAPSGNCGQACLVVLGEAGDGGTVSRYSGSACKGWRWSGMWPGTVCSCLPAAVCRDGLEVSRETRFFHV